MNKSPSDSKTKQGTARGASNKLIAVRFAPVNNLSVQRPDSAQSRTKGGAPVARKMFDPLAGP